MTRVLVLVLVVLGLESVACNKPSESSCRKAIRNMQRLIGTDKLHSAQNVESAVRSCRGASHKDSVECAIQAQTLEQLKHCSFYREQGGKDEPAGSGTGSAPAPAPAPPGSGSAGSGTAAP